VIPRSVWTVLRKELREMLRDRRTLFTMLVIPTLLYPAMFVAIEQLTLFGQRRLDAEPATVGVQGAPDVRAFLDRDSLLEVTGPEGVATAASVRGGAVLAAVRVEGDPGGTRRVRLFYDATNDASRRAAERVGDRLEELEDTLLAGRLSTAGLPRSFAEPLAVADSSVATATETGGYALGRFLPAILILMTLLGTFYPAIDLAAGEKERGTLETLLTAPVPAREVVAGKFAAVALMGMAAALANLASMLLTMQSGIFRFARAAGLRFTLPWDSILLLILGLIPLAVLFAALFLGIAVRAQSFKEAQNALTPAQLAAILPVMLVSLPGIDLTPALAAVPVAGVALLFRDLMAGELHPLPALVAFATSILYAALALVFAARAFGREETLFGTGPQPVAGDWRRRLRSALAPRSGAPGPAAGVAFIAVIGLLYFHLGGALQGTLGETGLLWSQIMLLAVPSVLFATLRSRSPADTLGLRRPDPRSVLAALLIALGGVPVGWLIGWLQLPFFPEAAEVLRGLEQLLRVDSAGRGFWLLLLVALTPAVCEELVFRGVLLRSLGRGLPPLRAIGATALVFAAFHLSFETALRFLPTLWIGVLMSYVAWRSGSLFPSMLMHFVNNATVVLLLWQPLLRDLVLEQDRPATGVVLLGPVLLAAGLWLLHRSRPPAESTEMEETQW
jgi:sodium transport system permease protein